MAATSRYMQAVVRGHALSTGESKTRPVFNVYNFVRANTVNPPSKVAFLAAFGAQVTANLATVLSVSYVHDFTDVRLLDDPYDPFVTAAGTDNGTVAGDSLPSLNNVTLRLKTGIRGRKFRGSKHFGPIAESDTTLDHLTVAALANWNTFAGQLLAGFTDANLDLWTPVVVSYRLSTFNPTTANVVATPITLISVNTILGQMKRRKQPSA